MDARQPEPIDSVLLIGFGGPERAEDIRPFLALVTEGRRIPPERLEEVAHHYELIGGRSPFNELTRRQAEGLRRALDRAGRGRPVHVGLRNWRPFLHETLAAMAAAGCRHALGIILSPFQTEASWERYQEDVARARAGLTGPAPLVSYAPGWSDHPLFVEAMTDRTAAALAQVPPERRRAAQIVFTAHSLPVSMEFGSPYAKQLESTARAIAARLGHASWSVAYQSRSGSPREPWLEPELPHALRELSDQGIADVVVSPVGFVCDHVEVLYDLDVEARAVAAECGLGFHRASTVNDHPAFIAMLADLVAR